MKKFSRIRTVKEVHWKQIGINHNYHTLAIFIFLKTLTEKTFFISVEIEKKKSEKNKLNFDNRHLSKPQNVKTMSLFVLRICKLKVCCFVVL